MNETTQRAQSCQAETEMRANVWSARSLLPCLAAWEHPKAPASRTHPKRFAQSHTSSLARSLEALLMLLCGMATLVQAAVVPSTSTLPPVNANFRAPARVAVAPNGNVYVADSAAGRVVVMDAFNRFLSEKTGFHTPLGIAVDADGNVYLGEADTGSVTVFDPQWKPLSQLGAGQGEFGLPSFIAIDPGTTPPTVYVSDSPANALKAYQAGTRIRTLGGADSSSAKFDFPAGVWVNEAGEVFGADQNNERVLVFARDGTFLRGFNLGLPFTSGSMGRPQGLVGDGQGRIFLADTFQDFIKVFDEQGTLLTTFSGYGQGPGQLRSPAGLAVDLQGRLFVASPNTARVETFGLDCFTQLVATPSSQKVPAGATVTFSAATSCGDAFSYQWRKGTNALVDGGVVSGATNSMLTLTGISSADAGPYSVVVSGAAGTVVSPEALLTVVPGPVLVSSPLSRTAGQGSTVSFSVSASGPDLTYRWFFNGNELLGANTNMLVLTNVQPWAAGNYWAMVTNSAGAVTSAQASLSVVVFPTVLVGPTNLTVAEHGTAYFSVLANGSAPLRYQWYFGQSPLPNQTNSTLVLTNVSAGARGSYYALVSNGAGATNSTAATLAVLPDTTAPVALYAAGGAATSQTILVSFSEPVNVASAQQPSNYQLQGPGGLSVISAVVTNGSRVLLRLSGSRSAAGDYSLRIQNVLDTAFQPNLMSPNPACLSVLVSDAYGTAAWWPLDEASGTVAHDATGNGFDGTLENATWTTGRTGSAVNLDGSTGDVVIPALNLYTNSVTITAWIKRSGSQASSAGIFFTRAGNTVAGLRFGSTNDLRYNWADASATYNFSSGLVPADGQWAFTAVTIEPTRAILYLNTGTGLRSATNTTTHAVEEFNGISYMGWDTYSSSRRFKGVIEDVHICNRALSAAELQALYTAVVTPASCAISAPLNGSVVTTPNPTVNANVATGGNAISKVEFLSGGQILGAARSAPYTFTWTNLASGKAYAIQARTYYAGNYIATSPLVSFSVKVPITSAMAMNGNDLTLSWAGGSPPYQVQVTTNLLDNPVVWTPLGDPTTNASMVIQPPGDAAFYRVIGN